MTCETLRGQLLCTAAFAILAAAFGCRAAGSRIATADGTRSVPATSVEPSPAPALNANAVASVPRADTSRAVRLVSADAAARDGEEAVDVSPQPEEAVPTAHSLDLATLLSLVDGQNPQVALARERIAEAQAQSDRAKSLWLPSIRAG